MFDLRYHVVSLAAVFLALVIGILVGVGISESGGVDEFEKSALQARVAGLESELERARQQATTFEREEDAARTIIKESYPVLIRDRLVGKRVALVFVGSVADVRADVETTLEDAGAGAALRMRTVKVPIDPERVDEELAGNSDLAEFRGREQLGDLGRALAEEFVAGGDVPLWEALSDQLVVDREGGGKAAADAVVVSRTAPAQGSATSAFLRGFYAGLAASDVPVVGVEAASEQPSWIPLYDRVGLSTVDSVDTDAGRLALALLLAGADGGNYGLKESAEDGILPPIEPLPPAGG